ncbi:hypothetical protein FQA39_LY13036 [Lamprigera yunnana]|nr:hypothetical protein FQA39_LY13036 [Lamprigera yunnana]
MYSLTTSKKVQVFGTIFKFIPLLIALVAGIVFGILNPENGAMSNEGILNPGSPDGSVTALLNMLFTGGSTEPTVAATVITNIIMLVICFLGVNIFSYIGVVGLNSDADSKIVYSKGRSLDMINAGFFLRDDSQIIYKDMGNDYLSNGAYMGSMNNQLSRFADIMSSTASCMAFVANLAVCAIGFFIQEYQFKKDPYTDGFDGEHKQIAEHKKMSEIFNQMIILEGNTMNKNKIFDAHIHFNDEDFYTIDEIPLFIKEVSSRKAVLLSKQYENVYAAIALHPNVVRDFSLEAFDELDELAKDEKVVAIGETGLDYFYTEDDIDMQKNYFVKHIELAKNNNKVLQVHIRDKKDVYKAYDDVLEITRKYDIKRKVVHCFSANAQYAQKFLDEGMYISINGNVTRNKDLQDVVRELPLDKIVVETDSPYMIPEPYSRQLNYPKFLPLIVEAIANIHKIDRSVVATITTENAVHCF